MQWTPHHIDRPYFIESSVSVSCCNVKNGAISIAVVAFRFYSNPVLNLASGG